MQDTTHATHMAHSLSRPPRPDYATVFFFNDTATTEISTLSLHDALPISPLGSSSSTASGRTRGFASCSRCSGPRRRSTSMRSTRNRASSHSLRSEEHTSELQSPDHLVSRLLLEKKKTRDARHHPRNTHGPLSLEATAPRLRHSFFF